MPEVLRDRNFRLLLAGQAISQLGDRVLVVALAFAVIEVGGGAAEVGLVFAARTGALAASVLIGGVVADRLPRRTVMVAADLVRLAGQGTLAALLIAGAPPVWSLAALAALTGGAAGFYGPASTALLPAVVAPALLPQANGLRSTALALGEVLGPALGGALVVAAGPGWGIAVDAGTYAVSAAALIALRLAPVAPRARASFLADLRGGWHAFSSRAWVWSMVASFTIVNFWWAAWSALGPVVADRELGGAGAWGTILAAMGVGGLAGSVIAIRATPRRPLVVVVGCLVLFGLPPLALAATDAVALVAFAALLAGGGLMLGNAVWESTLQRLIPEEALARVSAYDWFGSLVLTPVGLAVWGPLAAGIGVATSLYLAAALLVATALAPLAVAGVRRISRTDVPAPGVHFTPD